MCTSFVLLTKYLPFYFLFVALLTRFGVVLSWVKIFNFHELIVHDFMSCLHAISYDFFSYFSCNGGKAPSSIIANTHRAVSSYQSLRRFGIILKMFVDFGEVGYPGMHDFKSYFILPIRWALLFQWDFWSHWWFKSTSTLSAVWFVVIHQIRRRGNKSTISCHVLSQCIGDLKSPHGHCQALYDF